jgi:hypothetical protein
MQYFTLLGPMLLAAAGGCQRRDDSMVLPLVIIA